MRKALNKLTGKLERLGKDARAYVAVASDKKKLEAENKRLLAALRAVSVPYDIRKTKAENERLRAFAQFVQDHSNDPGVVEAARRALEGR